MTKLRGAPGYSAPGEVRSVSASMGGIVRSVVIFDKSRDFFEVWQRKSLN
jgi:hypothetical protein